MLIMMPQSRQDDEMKETGRERGATVYCWHSVVRHNVMLPGMHYASTSLLLNLLSCVMGKEDSLYCIIAAHADSEIDM